MNVEGICYVVSCLHWGFCEESRESCWLSSVETESSPSGIMKGYKEEACVALMGSGNLKIALTSLELSLWLNCYSTMLHVASGHQRETF
jgi:hypothetical protein